MKVWLFLRVYVKIFLYIVKYLYKVVNGVFLGVENFKDGEIYVFDVIFLFYIIFGLVFMLEVVLVKVERSFFYIFKVFFD